MHRIILIFFFLLPTLLFAQKQDYYWPFGSDQDSQPGVQASEIRFNKLPIEARTREGGLEFDNNKASICDENGALLFYTNGCAVANQHHEIMPHGDSLNFDDFFVEFWGDDCGNGYPGKYNIYIIDAPENDSLFYIIHKVWEETSELPTNFSNRIQYSIVNIHADNGNGDVIVKNEVVVMDSVESGYLALIKKQNGIDWWILQPGLAPDLFHRLEVTADGVQDLAPQYIQRHYDPIQTGSSGGAKFSPDGTKYCYYSTYDGLYLYDFDRSTGLLSNLRLMDTDVLPLVNISDIEFSPNSRFIYFNVVDTLYQLDSWEPDLADGVRLIAPWNGVADPLNQHSFSNIQAGPDCRIYVRTGASTNSFHVVHDPDELGTACNFEQQAIQLPYIAARSGFPHFPQWRVDETEKCDDSLVTMFGELVYTTTNLNLYPNPASDWLQVELPDQYPNGRLVVYDVLGNVWMDSADEQNGDYQSQRTLDTSA